MAARKNKKIQRRTPRRAGAVDTVEVIFEATARILAAEGREGLTTNRIAEKAGVSIGALYGYFPNKQAILLAMARRELDLMRDRVIAGLSAPDDGVPPLRRAVRALVAGYGARGRARRILMETLFSLGGSEEMARPVYEVAEVILARAKDILPAGAAPPSPVGLYVLTRAVDGVIRSATYENFEYLGSEAFEDEIIRLIAGYFSAPPVQQARSARSAL
jgi:AcrR family transcriptional regulator